MNRLKLAVAGLAIMLAGCAGPVESPERVATIATEQGFRLDEGELAFCGLTRIEQPEQGVTLWIYVGAQGKIAVVALNTKTGQMVASSSLSREDAERIAREK